MDVHLALPLLGGLSPALFMQRHWQKKPLLVRQAWPGVQPPLARAALFDLAGRADVESRLVQQQDGVWQVRHGPLQRRAMPPVSRPGWTLLVQGLDLHVPAAHELLQAFRFVPEARLDDLMVSWASPGGGVGPHADSYDVFLLQVQGHRRWRVGARPARGEPAWLEGAPLKLLRDFAPTQDWLLAPGDMLYLPPRWGHEGSAEGGACMTCSVGFRAPAAGELTREVLLRLADEAEDAGPRFRDPHQPATANPGALPEALVAFARDALAQHLADPQALARVLGGWLSEPKPQVCFDAVPAATLFAAGAVALSPRTRMLYDPHHIFINGEAFAAAGRDAKLMRRLADRRVLAGGDRLKLSAEAADLLTGWLAAGWVEGLST